MNVFANLVNSNRGPGIAVLQSSQLTRLVTNCILENDRGGVTVEKDCRVELRGNGIYENRGHGVRFSGIGQIVENDVVGNHGNGIQVSASADIKVDFQPFFFFFSSHSLLIVPLFTNPGFSFCLRLQVMRNRVQPAQGCGIALLGAVKGLIHDNILFEGHPDYKKKLIHLDSGNESCVLHNNILRHNNR